MEETVEGEKLASDGAEIPSEEAPETPLTPVAEAATQDDELGMGSDDESSAEEDTDESADEGVSPSNTDEELQRYMAAAYGAGRGYTGIGVGESVYTGMGAGEGYTGIGAGPGFTGMFTSAPSETAASSPSESAAPQTRPVVVLLPIFVSPWGAYLAHY